MTNKELLELVDVVDNINEKLSEQLGPNNIDYLEIRYNTWSCGVHFLDEFIWSSEDDKREYLEDKDDYEPFGPFLRKKITEFINRLNKITL